MEILCHDKRLAGKYQDCHSLSVRARGLIAECVIAGWLLVHYRAARRQKPLCTPWVTMTLSSVSILLPCKWHKVLSHHQISWFWDRPTNSPRSRAGNGQQGRFRKYLAARARYYLIHLFWVFWETCAKVLAKGSRSPYGKARVTQLAFP